MSSEPEVWPAGYGRLILGAVDSTNSEAARLAPGLTQPTWIMARTQTAGRGRRSREWQSPIGNFYATLVLRPAEPPAVVALRSFVAALAVHDTLVAMTGRAEGFGLKWPNDVLLHGGKVAGVLLESASIGAGVSYLAIGIGVNLISAPEPGQVEPGALRPVSVLRETGMRIRPEDFLDSLAMAYSWDERSFVTEGFARFRQSWLARAARLGEPITARYGAETRQGIFETIDDRGALVLRTNEGPVAIAAADVYF